MAVRPISAVLFCAGIAAVGMPSAQAGVCDALFMHDGGKLQIKGSGNLALGADLAFSEVAKTDGDNCRARLNGVATFAYAGLQPGKSKLDYLMTIKKGQANFVRYEKAGDKPAADGQFDLRMLGLFAYDAKALQQGKSLPGTSFRLNIGKASPGVVQPGTVVRIGEKKVGAKETLDTAIGKQVCWPIRYTRNSDPSFATFNRITVPIPGINSTVTDWFCPNTNLVMKQDIDQSGTASAVEITEIK